MSPSSVAWRTQLLRILHRAGSARLAREILWDYALVRWWLVRFDIREAVAAARPQTRTGPANPDMRPMAIRLGRAVSRTLSALPTDSRCLVQALVLSRLLDRRGVHSTFVIGAQSSPDFQAHAWVECNGQPVLPVRGFQQARLLEL